MCSRARVDSLALVAGVLLLVAAGCGGEERTTIPAVVSSVEPACVADSRDTSITIRGAMPVKPVVSLGGGTDSTLETGYAVFIGDVQLRDVRWVDATTLTATVPAGITPGTYALTISSPFGEESSLAGAVQVAAGVCGPGSAVLALTAGAAPTVVRVGEEVVVTATVENTGQSAATGVTTTVSAPPGFTLSEGATNPLDVAAGESQSFVWRYTADAGAASGSFTITAAGTDSASGEPVSAPQASTNRVAVAYLVGGTVAGLEGSGLVLRLNGIADLPVAASGGAAVGFSFDATPLASGSVFSVTVERQPTNPAQTCTVTGGTGTVGTGDVNSVVVNCGVNTFTVGGNVSDLAGSGLVLREATSNQEVTVTSVGTYAFPTPIRSGRSYNVMVETQPSSPAQVCGVSNPSGTVSGTDVTNVDVTCTTATFTIGGTVSGASGTGLVLALNGLTQLPATNGAFSFPAVPSGTQYAVTVQTQPTNPTQVCTVVNGTGTVGAAPVTNIAVTCATSTFSVGGTVTNLTGSGLVLANGTATVQVPPGTTTFAFTGVPSGTQYAVTVQTQPTNPTQVCTVANGSGTVGGANVTSVTVSCQTTSFNVFAQVTELTGSGLQLQLNGAARTVAADGLVNLGLLPSGTSYTVTVLTQPTGPSQTCAVTNGTGTITSADVTVTVTCATSTFTVGGTVTGLAGSGLVLANGSATVLVPLGATSFAFPVPSGASYAVTVATQPTNPTQVCTVANGAGTVGGANVTSVSVTCTTTPFNVSAQVSGLAGSGMQLQLNAVTTVAVAMNGLVSIGALPSGTPYTVSVLTQPTSPAQTCTVTNGSGTIAASDVTATVTCTTNAFTVGGTVNGLLGNRVVLQLSILGSGTTNTTVNGPPASPEFTFGTPVPSGRSYQVSVVAQPQGPAQTCLVTQGAIGTMGAEPVTNVVVTCTSDG